MSTRREAREYAVQLLFQLDMNENRLEEVFNRFWSELKADKKAREYAEKLVRGVRENIAEIDGIIKKYAEHWDIHRMSVIVRNVMRLAIYEMKNCKDVPPVVVINEAVDVSKYFSDSSSGKFVNGILDRIRKEMEKENAGR